MWGRRVRLLSCDGFLGDDGFLLSLSVYLWVILFICLTFKYVNDFCCFMTELADIFTRFCDSQRLISESVSTSKGYGYFAANSQLIAHYTALNGREVFLVDKGRESGCYVTFESVVRCVVVVASECLPDYLSMLLRQDDVVREEILDDDPLVHQVRINFERYLGDVNRDGGCAGTFYSVGMSDIEELLCCFYPAVSGKP